MCHASGRGGGCGANSPSCSCTRPVCGRGEPWAAHVCMYVGNGFHVTKRCTCTGNIQMELPIYSTTSSKSASAAGGRWRLTGRKKSCIGTQFTFFLRFEVMGGGGHPYYGAFERKYHIARRMALSDFQERKCFTSEPRFPSHKCFLRRSPPYERQLGPLPSLLIFRMPCIFLRGLGAPRISFGPCAKTKNQPDLKFSLSTLWDYIR